MIFDICIAVMVIALTICAAALSRKYRKHTELLTDKLVTLAGQQAALTDRLNAAETLLSELKTQLEDLDPQGGVDVVALEKAFNEGVERIMNYNLATAMGGGKNG